MFTSEYDIEPHLTEDTFQSCEDYFLQSFNTLGTQLKLDYHPPPIELAQSHRLDPLRLCSLFPYPGPMNIQFDPFSFSVATFALAVAVMQLYWNRPQHHDAVSR